MGNTVVAFRLYSPSGPLQLLFFLRLYSCTIMTARKSSSDAGYISKYIEARNNSSEEEKDIETFEFADFEPFMGMFRQYRPELTETEKESVMTRGLINLRKNPHMPDIMRKMFDYDLEVSDLERDLFSVKEKIEPIFNFIDVSFQLLDGPADKIVALLIKKITALRKYYDQKSTLNMHHSECIIDLFRFCARKDRVLLQALEGDFTGFTFESETKQAPEQKLDTTTYKT